MDRKNCTWDEFVPKYKLAALPLLLFVCHFGHGWYLKIFSNISGINRLLFHTVLYCTVPYRIFRKFYINNSLSREIYSTVRYSTVWHHTVRYHITARYTLFRIKTIGTSIRTDTGTMYKCWYWYWFRLFCITVLQIITFVLFY